MIPPSNDFIALPPIIPPTKPPINAPGPAPTPPNKAPIEAPTAAPTFAPAKNPAAPAIALSKSSPNIRKSIKNAPIAPPFPFNGNANLRSNPINPFPPTFFIADFVPSFTTVSVAVFVAVLTPSFPT